MRSLHLLSAIAVLAAAVGCSGSSYMSGGGCTGSGASVAVCDNFYSPGTTTITAGSSVTWTWKGTRMHSVSFTSGSLNGTGSATMSSGTFTQPFATPGAYTYQCAVHGAAMGGTITVN